MVRRPDETSDETDSLVALLSHRASEGPAAALFSFLPDGDAAGEVVLTRGELDRRARALAGRLQARGLAGARALLIYPPGLEFIAAFFGCLYARAVAVPAYPPRPNRPMTRLLTIVEDARPSVVLTCGSLRKDAGRWSAGIPDLAGIEVLFSDEEDSEESADRWIEPEVTGETLAFLQYTSGSTAAPKGVMITHGNLMANSARIHEVFGSVPGERGVFWLPLFHDMGLIGGVLQALYCGGASTLFPPASFLQRPLRWLQAISRTGALISGAPNFAYDLCVEKTTPEQRAELDLTRWKVAFNGAEPIRAETLERFAEAFATSGFRPEAFLPCYGMAEATLLVSGNPTGRRPTVVSVDAAALGRGEATDPNASGPAARLVSSGRPVEGHVVAIVDPSTGHPCDDGRVGEVWFAGPSAAQGYWNRPEETLESMGARLAGHEGRAFLRTGDLGFLRGGELFVTGRIKDLIILRGRNIYPQDVEWAAERSHPALRAGGAAAFAVEVAGEERLAVVIEIERRLPAGSADDVLAAIRRGVAEALDVELSAIRLLKPTTLPRTSSGKVQRHACREAFLAGTLETVAEWTRPIASEAPSREAEAPPPPPLLTKGGFGGGPERPAPSESRYAITAWLAAKVAEPLGVRPDEVDIRAPLAGFGIGSLQAVRLAGELEERLGRKLAPTLVYDYPTIDALAGFLAGEATKAAPAPTAPDASINGREPIAIIGISCRIPGASGAPAFWELLRGGVEAIGEVPDERWTEQDLHGLDFPRRSGFLRGIDRFDANFFGIKRREAIFLDPQQRMLMEVAWEALEDAGQVPGRLAGAPVGVFIGISTNDYAFIQVKRGGAAIGHRITGNSGCIAANRISHFFDFRGPSLAIDTACSSSLVATLQACRSLWDGESEVALAGGSNLLLQTQVFAGFAKSGFLSPDGHCRAFDAEANGYVRGEGVGIVVLKPVSRALADGDPIYAVIRGGAVNQDGRTNGLTAPSGAAQEAVLRAAYRHAGVSPGQVDYVEAHGTGTPLGDPIELAALGAVLAEGRDGGRRCAIGSVKTNIGHLEAAAGVAGLIKAALALHHRAIPASLNYSRPNPHVDLDALPLRIAGGLEPWPATRGPACAGVSSFGFGGTNAHIVVEEAPRRAHRGPLRGSDGRPDGDVVIPLSARTSDALTDLCRSFRDFLSGAPDDLDLRDVAYSAGARRGHLEHRLALVVAGRDEAIGALNATLRGEPHISVATGRRRPGLRHAPVFVFSDGRAIRRHAARDLFRREPAFRAAVERCHQVLGRELGWSLVAGLEDGPSSRDTPEGDAPLRFAVQVALAALWESWGLAPGACVGDGIGEVAAAHVSGELGLEDAAKIVAGRGTNPPGAPTERFRGDLSKLAAAGHDVFLKIGAQPGLAATIRGAVGRDRASPLILSSLRGSDRGLESLRWSAAFLYAAGFEIGWDRVSPPGRFIRLPSYPWRRERYWLDEEAPPQAVRARDEIPLVEISSPRPRASGLANGHLGSPEGGSPPPAADGHANGHLDSTAGEPPLRIAVGAQPADLVGYLRDRVAGLLGLPPDQVDLERPLLALGLDSIVAMELKLDVDGYLGVKLPLSVLIEATSIRDVAERARALAAQGEGATPRPSSPAHPASAPEVPPAGAGSSHGQQMLWYAHQFTATGAAYHIAGAGLVRAELDLDAARRALRRVIDRHEALRSTFPAVDGAPVLRVIDAAALAAREGEWFLIEDATADDLDSLSARLTELARRPFDLQDGPLFRVHLLTRSPSEHIILLAFHHIIGDFLSSAVFIDDLGWAYGEERAGRPGTWPPLRSSFGDFVRWQDEMLAGDEGERLWAYWQRRLAGALPVLDLPTDHPRPAIRSDRGRTHHGALEPGSTGALVALGRERGASLYTTLLAAFQVFLARYAGQDEVIVGSPAAGRTRPGLDGLVGYFVNMLPMRAGIADDPPFAEFLARVRRTVAEGLEHQDFPFRLMVNRRQGSPQPSRTPIFQVMFAHQRPQRLAERGLAPFALGVPGARLDLYGLPIESIALDRQTAMFELTLMTARDGDRLRLAWEYSTDLFADETIEQMASGFRALLEAISADPGQRLSRLPLMSAEDRHRVLDWWSVGPESSHHEAGIHHRFEREAAAAPDATALVFDDESLTYGELNRLANVVARHLIDRGVGPEAVVGLFLGRWPLRLIGLLGVLKAGAAYVPLDPEHPTERLAAAFEDSGAALLLTDDSLRDRLPSFRSAAVEWADRLVDSAAGDDPGNPEVPVDGDTLAYVIFTSGTSGRPKGVMVHHRALLAVATAWEPLYDLRGTTRRHLQAAPFAFDVFTGDWVRALTTGGTLVACPRPVLVDPAALAALIRRHGVDGLELVPAIAEALAEHLEAEPGEAPLPLRLLTVGSDSLRSGLLRRLRRLLPTGARVVNSYGLTEAAIDSACFDPGSEDSALPPGDAPAPIGGPLPGARAYVLDRHLTPVPPGVVGELYIGGPGVARGYVADPAGTAERFVPDPFGAAGSRMYATGDRARWRAGGVLELLGRSDGQVKVRGVRIELAEVEAALARHPAVKQAAVVAREDAHGEKRLAAYFVPAEPAGVGAADLRRWLRNRLPDAMVPSWLIEIASLPLSPNGKVDRAALPPPGEDGEAGTSQEYAPPRTAAERTLAAIAAGLLERECVGIHDNFFDLGVDSIFGIRFVSRARQAGLTFAPAQLFKTPTIAGLAAAVSSDERLPDEPAIAAEPFSLIPGWLDRGELERTFAAGGGIEDAYPLTPVQQGMLFHTLVDPEAGHYVEQFVCGLRGALDLPALGEAWHRLIARHPALRSTIHWGDGGQPYQVVHRRAAPAIDHHDWRELPAPEQQERLAGFLAADRRAGFEPSRPPLSRVALIRIDQDLHQLIWSIHHVVLDGWCLSVLLHEALDTYEALRRGAEPAAAPTRPFRDYVAWLRGRDEAGAEAYWRGALRGISEPTPLGLDGLTPDRAGGESPDAAEREIVLEPAASSALQDLARSRRLTLSTLVQGAWALLLGRYSGRSDVVFGVTVSGRPPELAGVETMVGMFINVLPLRVAVDESARLIPWLLGLQDRLVELRRFEAVPLARIQGWSVVPPGRPLFESIVTVQNLPFVDTLRERADRLGVESPRYLERTHYPIAVTILPDTALRIKIGFDARRFATDAIERVLGHLRALLLSMANNPEVRLADLPWALESEGESAPGQRGRPPDEAAWGIELPDLDRLDEGELDVLLDQLG
jgi:amino acid adenylation domain-containing protein